MVEKRKNPDGTYKEKWKDFYTKDKSSKWRQAMTSDRKNNDGSYNKTSTGKDWGEKYKESMMKPLTDKQYAELETIYYYEGGYRGRDQMYDFLKRKEAKNKGSSLGISENQMSKFFLKLQETQQLHRDMPQKSLSIKPILEKEKMGKIQADLIIKVKGKGGINIPRAILTVIDVATRKAWARVLKNTTAKSVFTKFLEILKDAKLKPRLLMTDNGSEFKEQFHAGVKKLKIKHVYGQPHRSNSQAHVERFNKSLQSSIQKELTSTRRKDWYNLVDEHVAFYNDKPNSNVRIKRDEEDGGTYQTFTPNKLWKVSNERLKELYDVQVKKMFTEHKMVKGEDKIKVGDKVRMALFNKRKNALKKGFRVNWTKEIYTIKKILKPKDGDTKPYIYFAEDSKGKMYKHKLTIKDILPLPKDKDGNPMPVKKPPKELRKEGGDLSEDDEDEDEEEEEEDEDKDEVTPESTESEEQAKNLKMGVGAGPSGEEAEPSEKAKKLERKTKPSKSQHKYIGRKVREWRDDGKGQDEVWNGTIVKRTKQGTKWVFQIRYDNGETSSVGATETQDKKNLLETLMENFDNDVQRHKYIGRRIREWREDPKDGQDEIWDGTISKRIKQGDKWVFQIKYDNGESDFVGEKEKQQKKNLLKILMENFDKDIKTQN